MSNKRTYTQQQKEELVAEADSRGYGLVARERGVAKSMLYRWKERLQNPLPLPSSSATAEESAELKRLRMENTRLKTAVADLTLEVMVKNSLLKKNNLRVKIES
jgi:transposase-like protein